MVLMQEVNKAELGTAERKYEEFMGLEYIHLISEYGAIDIMG